MDPKCHVGVQGDGPQLTTWGPGVQGISSIRRGSGGFPSENRTLEPFIAAHKLEDLVLYVFLVCAAFDYLNGMSGKEKLYLIIDEELIMRLSYSPLLAEGYVIKLETAFHELAQGFYQQKLKTIRARAIPNNSPALVVRQLFKQAFLSELRLDTQTALSEDMVRIKQDYMLLGAGVVVAAVVCAHGAKYLDQASRQHSEMSGTPEEDVRAFAVTLLHVKQIIRRFID